jgi:hypothetical protein
MTPMRWPAVQRLLAAQRFLESARLSVEDIAERTGLGIVANLRLHMARRLGTTRPLTGGSCARRGSRSARRSGRSFTPAGRPARGRAPAGRARSAHEHLHELLDNNARFAMTDAKDKVPAIAFIPSKQVYVLTCVDPRSGPGGHDGARTR